MKFIQKYKFPFLCKRYIKLVSTKKALLSKYKVHVSKKNILTQESFFYKNIKLNSNKKNNTGDSQKHCKNNAGYFSQLRSRKGKYKKIVTIIH